MCACVFVFVCVRVCVSACVRVCVCVCIQLPLWSSGRDVEKVVRAADSSMPLMLESYRKWCGTGGPEEDFVNSGDTAAYRSLGRAR